MSTPLDFTSVKGVELSATAFDVDSGEVLFSHQPRRVLATASIGKLFLLYATLDMARTGELDLEERLWRRPSERVGESGLWYLLEQDSLTIFDIGMLIGAMSDNFATNVLIRRVGLERTAQCVRDLGYRHSGLHDFIRWPRPPGAPAQLSTGTASEISDFLARLARDELFDESQSELFRRWLGAGADTSMVASAFELDPLAHYLYTRGIWLWNKTGTDETIRADCGVVMTPQRRVSYAVFANWEAGSDRVMEVMPVMRKVGDVLAAYLQPEGTNAD